jgi:hypothetical protein
MTTWKTQINPIGRTGSDAALLAAPALLTERVYRPTGLTA